MSINQTNTSLLDTPINRHMCPVKIYLLINRLVRKLVMCFLSYMHNFLSSWGTRYVRIWNVRRKGTGWMFNRQLPWNQFPKSKQGSCRRTGFWDHLFMVPVLRPCYKWSQKWVLHRYHDYTTGWQLPVEIPLTCNTYIIMYLDLHRTRVPVIQVSC